MQGQPQVILSLWPEEVTRNPFENLVNQKTKNKQKQKTQKTPNKPKSTIEKERKKRKNLLSFVDTIYSFQDNFTLCLSNLMFSQNLIQPLSNYRDEPDLASVFSLLLFRYLLGASYPLSLPLPRIWPCSCSILHQQQSRK